MVIDHIVAIENTQVIGSHLSVMICYPTTISICHLLLKCKISGISVAVSIFQVCELSWLFLQRPSRIYFPYLLGLTRSGYICIALIAIAHR